MHMRPSAPTITCRACGAEYNTVERMRWMLDREPDHLGTIAFIDSALVTAGYIQPGNAVKWLQRDERRAADARRFFPWRTDGLGHDLFRLGDFVERAKMGDVRRMTRVTQELGATG